MNRVYKWYIKMHRSNSKIYRRVIEVMLRLVFSCDISAETIIGKNCIFAHNALGVVISSKAIIGDNVHIGQNVTIGGRGGNPEVPIIGDRVLIGSHALILGKVRIGNGAKIGAGAIVVKDIPENATAISPECRIIECIEAGL